MGAVNVKEQAYIVGCTQNKSNHVSVQSTVLLWVWGVRNKF